MAAAARLNCSWCMDFGSWEGRSPGLPAGQIERVPNRREEREAFTEPELLVMEYAQAMTGAEPTVTGDLAAELIARLGEAAFVELTAMVALENRRSHVNLAFGLTSQGFAQACAVRPGRGAQASGVSGAGLPRGGDEVVHNLGIVHRRERDS